MGRRIKELKPWTFTVEEFKHWHESGYGCECDACKRINEYYKIDEETKALLRKKYE
jgi:hypothetical protein